MMFSEVDAFSRRLSRADRLLREQIFFVTSIPIRREGDFSSSVLRELTMATADEVRQLPRCRDT